MSIPKPWRIIYAANRSGAPGVQFAWKKIDDNDVAATPALLNPGDRVFLVLFLTNPTEKGEQTGLPKVPDLKVDARISNLKSFTPVPFPSGGLKFRTHDVWGIIVGMTGWAVPYFILMFSLLQVLYIILLTKAKLLNLSQKRFVGYLVASSLLSITGAETSTTYAIGSTWTDMYGINHWLNAPWIVLNIVLIALLYVYGRRLARQQLNHQ